MEELEQYMNPLDMEELDQYMNHLDMKEFDSVMDHWEIKDLKLDFNMDDFTVDMDAKPPKASHHQGNSENHNSAEKYSLNKRKVLQPENIQNKLCTSVKVTKKQEVQPLITKDEPKLDILNSTAYCFPCSKQFKSKKVLTEHNICKHIPKHLPCDKCNMVFPMQCNLAKHVRERHMLVNLKCKFCGQTFASIKNLKRHLHVLHVFKMQKNEQYSFASDNIVLLNNNDSNKYLQKHQTFDSNNQFKDHLSDTENVSSPTNLDDSNKSMLGHENRSDTKHLKRGIQRVACEHCDLTFASKWHQKRHMDRIHSQQVTSIHPIIRYQCQVCKQEFSMKYYFNKHTLLTHPVPEQLNCDICHVTFDSIDQFKDHLSNVHSVSKYGCVQCEKVFLHKKGLKRHENNAHSRTLSKIQSSLIFTRLQNFTDAENVSDTMHLKGSIQRVACEQCDLTFASKWHQKRHMNRIHKQSSVK